MTTTDTGAALLRAILDDPASDERRLIYSDWLEDQGQAERGMFIKVQCELARMERWSEGQFLVLPESREGQYIDALRHRERALRKTDAMHAQFDAFAALFGLTGKFASDHGYGGGMGGRQWEWRRGFVEFVSCQLADWVGTECDNVYRNNGSKCNKGCLYTGMDGMKVIQCGKCHGLGRLNARGPAIVSQQPVARVVTDRVPQRYPITEPSLYGWFRGLRSHNRDELLSIPQFVWDAMKNEPVANVHVNWLDFPSEQAALAALSAALLRWARDAAGLPALQESKHP